MTTIINKAINDYRGLVISYETFHDLAHIALCGHSNHLMQDPYCYTSDSGMINLHNAVDALGLKYEPEWLGNVLVDWINESLISGDSLDDGDSKDDDGNWFYLNAGFYKIGELLYPKYYLQTDLSNPEANAVKDLILISLADRAVDMVDEIGNRLSAPRDSPYYYDLVKVINHDSHIFSKKEIDAALLDLQNDGYIECTKKNGGHFVAISRSGGDRAEEITARYYDKDDVHKTVPEGDLFFSVDASHIARLGVELVAKQETAVAELVKNGFDADATHVDLIFQSAEVSGGALEIQDNGQGMSRQELIDGFMRLSTNIKVKSPTSSKYGRKRAGRKGIGRFASQRLGTKLAITTATEDDEFAHQVRIDWDDFSANAELNQVSAKIKRVKKPFSNGTKLFISNLRDKWSDALIERSYRHVSELIQPFPLSKEASEEDKKTDDPGFKATFLREEDDDFRTIADDWTLYFKNSLAEIEGWVDEKGCGFWSVNSDKYKIAIKEKTIGPDKDDSSSPFDHLRTVHFKAYYYIDKEIAKGSRAKVKEKLQDEGGIRLYRNGFRVLPYGARYDDWLKLNASNLLRKILPPHSNRNFLGFVEILDIDGNQFEETASREGLVENESFGELKNFIEATLKSALMPIAEARNKRTTTTDTRRQRRTPRGQAEEIILRLEKLKAEAREAKEDKEFASALELVITEFSQSVVDLGNEGEALLEELGMMRVLASLGLAIGEFTHEIGLGFETLSADVGALGQKITDGTLQEEDGKALIDQIDNFRAYIEFFDTTVRDNVDRETHPIEIRDAVNSFIKFLRPRIDRNEINLKTDIQGFSLFTKPMHDSEWSSILVNLFTNSLKAIRRKRSKGKILIQAGKQDGEIYLSFSDNGDGIETKNRDKVFDAFFTTTSKAATKKTDMDSLAGMGLGLKIVKDVIDSSGGSISLIDAPSGYTTCFKVTVPEASDEEIPDDAF